MWVCQCIWWEVEQKRPCKALARYAKELGISLGELTSHWKYKVHPGGGVLLEVFYRKGAWVVCWDWKRDGQEETGKRVQLST